jgi:hypothetical protein
MIYLVLEFRKKKQTFAKIEKGNVDFFQRKKKETSNWARFSHGLPSIAST